MLDRKTQSLINTLYESHVPTNATKALLDPKKWWHVISLQEIRSLNKAYEKFLFAEPMIILESNGRILDRSKLWEQFLTLEDEKIYEARLVEQPAEPEEKKGFLSRAWGAVKKAAKSPLKALGGKRSFSRMGQSGREREEEFESLKISAQGVIGALNATVDNFKDYPNMDSNKEFQEMTIKALAAADEVIKKTQDPAAKAAAIEATKKWISYVLDQKLGDFYKKFEESSAHLDDLIVEAEGEDAQKPKKKGPGLAAKSGQSETMKGLKSNLAPLIAATIGGIAGAGALFLSSHPELFASEEATKALASGNEEEVTDTIMKKFGDCKVTEWSAQGSIDQTYECFFGRKPASSKDYIDFFKLFDKEGGDPRTGAEKFFDAAGIRKGGDPNNPVNPNYVLDRLAKMDPKKAFNMDGVGPMERWGGRAGIPVTIAGGLAKQLATTKVKRAIVKTILPAATTLAVSTGGAVAIGGLAAIAAAGLLSAAALKLIRMKGMSSSRAKFLDALIDKVGEFSEEQTNKAEEQKPGSADVVPNIVVNPATQDVTIPAPPGGNQDGTGGAKLGSDQGGGGGGQPGGPEEEGEEEDEKKGCDDATLREKLTAALSSVKFKSGGNAAVEKMIKAVSGKQPTDLEDLKKILNSNRAKPLKDATVTIFANSIADCYGFGEEGEEEDSGGGEGGPEGATGTTGPKLTGSDMKNIIDNVMDDMKNYRDRAKMSDGKDLKYRAVSRDVVTNLVKYLNDKGKLQYTEGDYNDDDGVIRKDIADSKSDEDFLRRIPPEYKSRMNNWNRSQPEVAADVNDMLGDNKLPLYMLANRRALLETLRLIRKHAKLLNESRRKNDAILLEKWQKMAGLSN